jgi:hypothetical protein
MLVDPGGLLYGTIAVGVLLAGETAQRETYAETVGAVAIALVLYWLAHSYVDFTSERFQQTAPLRINQFLRTLASELAILTGAAIPLLTVVISWLFAASLTSAVSAAIWTAAGVIVIIEVVAGVRAGQSGRELAVQTLVGAILGLLVIVLKIVLH